MDSQKNECVYCTEKDDIHVILQCMYCDEYICEFHYDNEICGNWRTLCCKNIVCEYCRTYFTIKHGELLCKKCPIVNGD